jgi:polysaccharide biosynthesis/export protein
MFHHAGQILRRPIFLLSAAMIITSTARSVCPSSANASSQETSGTTGATADYQIGPADVLSITVPDEPSLTGKYRVTESGMIQVPLIPQPLHVAGLTSEQTAQAISQQLKANEILLNPIVQVSVEEIHSRFFTMVGAVNRPSVYTMDRPNMTLMEAISTAGGLAPTSGPTAVIVHSGPAGSDTQDKRVIDLGKLVTGQDPTLNVPIKSGDMISISTAPTIYVVGSVNKPGGFAIQNSGQGLSVLQALGLAGGMTPVASGEKALIVRRLPGSNQEQDIPIDLQKLMEKKIGDEPLMANDILFVPESKAKKTRRAMAEVAKNTAGGLITVGLGYGVILGR